MASTDQICLPMITGSTVKRLNPLQQGIVHFASARQSTHPDQALQPQDIPKRFTRYGSLIMLGPTFLTHSPTWEAWYGSLSWKERAMLFEAIVEYFPSNTTHVAANAPIAARASLPASLAGSGEWPGDNVMRSPTGFLPLHGDFGPSQTLRSTSLCAGDFEQAYWTETVQLKNIVQVWAPRWTMFSRGNISEKSRILQEGLNISPFPGLSRQELDEDVERTDVVDFYVGIGYFAFCYLSRGVRRVWGWDINGWSIEGLRRGCLRNGWDVKVVRITSHGQFEDPGGALGLVDEIVVGHQRGCDIRCIAFLGDNVWAEKIMNEIANAFASRGIEGEVNVRHCNLGLLPTSQGSWEGALSVLGLKGGWLHVHENADIHAIGTKATEVCRHLQDASHTQLQNWSVTCEHVERVKTYAPGVMHCVFDMRCAA